MMKFYGRKVILFILLFLNCMIIKNDENEAIDCKNTSSALCTLAALSGSTSTGKYSVSGTITGLTTEGLVLQNASVDDITISANTKTFVFPSKVSGLYLVTVKKQPKDRVCAVSNGSGTATNNISNVVVYCCYRMGGSIQGCPLNSPSNVTTIAGVAGANGTTNGTGTNALFFYPYGMATDGINLYIADTLNHIIRKMVISSGVVTTIAGTAESSGSVDGPGAFAKFNNPGAITTDGTYLYIADSYNHTIRRLEFSNGIVTTMAGTAGVTGITDGTGISARFNNPFGITNDATNLYVTDGTNYTIRKINIASGVVTTIAGLAGTPGSADGTGTAARFKKPFGIITDGTNLYVTDADSFKILKIVIATGVVTTLAGGIEGSADGLGAAAQFRKPTGITTDGTNLYVTDSANQIIRQFEISTGVVTTIAGTAGVIGTIDGVGQAANLFYPYGVTTDGTSLYIADTDNNTIRKISASLSGVANRNRYLKDRFYLAGLTKKGESIW